MVLTRFTITALHNYVLFSQKQFEKQLIYFYLDSEYAFLLVIGYLISCVIGIDSAIVVVDIYCTTITTSKCFI